MQGFLGVVVCSTNGDQGYFASVVAKPINGSDFC